MTRSPQTQPQQRRRTFPPLELPDAVVNRLRLVETLTTLDEGRLRIERIARWVDDWAAVHRVQHAARCDSLIGCMRATLSSVQVRLADSVQESRLYSERLQIERLVKLTELALAQFDSIRFKVGDEDRHHVSDG